MPVVNAQVYLTYWTSGANPVEKNTPNFQATVGENTPNLQPPLDSKVTDYSKVTDMTGTVNFSFALANIDVNQGVSVYVVAAGRYIRTPPAGTPPSYIYYEVDTCKEVDVNGEKSVTPEAQFTYTHHYAITNAQVSRSLS